MNYSTSIGLDGYSSCSKGVAIFLTTAMAAIISAAAFIGNIMVIFSVYKTPSLRSNTNYYYVNMAVSDLPPGHCTLKDEFIINPGVHLQGPLATPACTVGLYFPNSIRSNLGTDRCR